AALRQFDPPGHPCARDPREHPVYPARRRLRGSPRGTAALSEGRVIAPVVLIGGSRGGIEALTEAFAALPSLLRAPIAVVLHRRADSTVSLANLVARRIHRAV